MKSKKIMALMIVLSMLVSIFPLNAITAFAELEERLKLLPIYIRTVQDKLAEEQARLKRVNRLADVYECVIEGNYIDNLVKEQKETELKNPRKK